MYAIYLDTCLRCNKLFGYNPYKVPSLRINDGPKQAICLDCHEILNQKRIELGLDPWPEPLSGAYEPINEDEDEIDD